MIKFKTVEEKEFNLVEFEIEGGVCTPEALKEITAPKVNYTKGVVISGRGPIWLFGTLIHEFHPARWVACYDPRLGGGVVVQSHDPDIQVGDVVPVEA